MERYELQPIGNNGDYIGGMHTSWYLIVEKTMYVFDMPYSNIEWILGKTGQAIIADVDKIVIFITSLKESRIGGLKTAIDVLVSMGEKYMTFIPNEIWMQGSNYLELVGANMGDCHLMKGDYYQDENVQVFPREVAHDGVIRSFAYVVYGGDLFINDKGTNWSLYYSPDNRTFMDDSVLASFLEDPREKTIYHCITCNIDDETHCYRDKIVKTLDKPMRKHVYPINIDDSKDIKKFRNQGFSI